VCRYRDGSSTLLAGVAKTSSGHIPPSFLISGNKDNLMDDDLQLLGLTIIPEDFLEKYLVLGIASEDFCAMGFLGKILISRYCIPKVNV
jgi:hypothetical protein